MLLLKPSGFSFLLWYWFFFISSIYLLKLSNFSFVSSLIIDCWSIFTMATLKSYSDICLRLFHHLFYLGISINYSTSFLIQVVTFPCSWYGEWFSIKTLTFWVLCLEIFHLIETSFSWLFWIPFWQGRGRLLPPYCPGTLLDLHWLWRTFSMLLPG